MSQKNYVNSINSAAMTMTMSAVGSEEKNMLAGGLAPKGLCPFFYHNLVPYIVTLLNGGWFRWVKRDKNLFYRRAPSKGLFKDQSVNSAFPNEVLVQCPNPAASVVAGVGVKVFDGKKTITLRILSSSEACLEGYKEGAEIEMNEEEFGMDPLSFNSFFPALLASSTAKDKTLQCKDPRTDAVYSFNRGDKPRGVEKSSDASDVCSSFSEETAAAETIKGPCRYHTRPVSGIKAAQKGFCLDAYHTVYPYGLAALYGAGSEVTEVNCPGVENNVTFKVERFGEQGPFIRSLKSLAAKVFEKVFHPVDLFDYSVSYTVTGVKGACPFGHKSGDSFEFNIKRKTELCPASFHSVYPYLFLKRRGVSFDWGSGGSDHKASCPDCMGAVYKF